MKKARIFLFCIALLSTVAIIVSFKAAKYNGLKAYVWETSYFTFGTIYTAVSYECLPKNPERFFTTTGQVRTTLYSITEVTTRKITLTMFGGTATITFADLTCITIPNTFTTILN